MGILQEGAVGPSSVDAFVKIPNTKPLGEWEVICFLFFRYPTKPNNESLRERVVDPSLDDASPTNNIKPLEKGTTKPSLFHLSPKLSNVELLEEGELGPSLVNRSPTISNIESLKERVIDPSLVKPFPTNPNIYPLKKWWMKLL